MCTQNYHVLENGARVISPSWGRRVDDPRNLSRRAVLPLAIVDLDFPCYLSDSVLFSSYVSRPLASPIGGHASPSRRLGIFHEVANKREHLRVAPREAVTEMIRTRFQDWRRITWRRRWTQSLFSHYKSDVLTKHRFVEAMV